MVINVITHTLDIFYSIPLPLPLIRWQCLAFADCVYTEILVINASAIPFSLYDEPDQYYKKVCYVLTLKEVEKLT